VEVPVRISRHYSDHQLKQDTFENRVAVYEDQIRGWFHDQARILEKTSDHAGYVLLLVAASYIEGYAVFRRGQDSRGQSKEFFRDAFKDICPLDGQAQALIDAAIDELYYQVRCGLFHLGVTRRKVVLSGQLKDPVRIELDSRTGRVVRIHVNPHKLLDTIEEHLSSYVMRLRDPAEQELRENFDTAWNLRLD
jgi:hypothetical protein